MPNLLVEVTESDRRMEICRSCEHFNPKRVQCMKCKCFMKLKTKLKDAQCPVGKW